VADPTRKNAPPYSEAQTKAWLAWLARGMQQHGQTVFMLEQLQATWLPTEFERQLYILATRLSVGLLYGMIFGGLVWCYWHSLQVIYMYLVYGIAFGLATGIHDLTRLGSGGTASSRWSRLQRIGSVGLTLCSGYIAGLFLLAVLGLLESATSGPREPRIEMQLAVNLVAMFVFLPTMALLWGGRTSGRNLNSDIQSVEALSWSWKPLAGMFLPPVFLGALVLLADRSRVGAKDGLVMFLYASALLLPIGAVLGLRAGVREMKTRPNQGIRLSVRSAALGGMLSGLMIAFIVCTVTFLFRSTDSDHPVATWNALRAALLDGLVIASAFGLLAATWFGGVDVLQHYCLRVQLWLTRRAPLNLVRFLDYAARDLNFLQKVGGGYIFIHRMLLEHFATMDRRGRPRPQPVPALAEAGERRLADD
jgi:hypothetical protein